RPVRILGGLGPDTGPVGQIVVPPDVGDLVERSDLGVQKGSQLGVLLAGLVGLTEALFDLGQTAGGDAIGTNLVDHVRLLSTLRDRGDGRLGVSLRAVAWRVRARIIGRPRGPTTPPRTLAT